MWPLILNLALSISQSATAAVARRVRFAALQWCFVVEIFWRVLPFTGLLRALHIRGYLLALPYGLSINIARTAVILELATALRIPVRRELIGIAFAGSAFIAAMGQASDMQKAMMFRQYYQVVLFGLAVAIVFGTGQKAYRLYGLAVVAWTATIAATGFLYRWFPNAGVTVEWIFYGAMTVTTGAMAAALKSMPTRKAAVLALWPRRESKVMAVGRRVA